MSSQKQISCPDTSKVYRRKKCKTYPNTARYIDQIFRKKPILGSLEGSLESAKADPNGVQLFLLKF